MSAFVLDSNNLLENNYYGLLVINVVENIGLSVAVPIGETILSECNYY